MGLAVNNRLRRPAEFRNVLKSGQRTGRRSGDRLLLLAATPNSQPCSRIGLSVSKRVGGSVVRSRIKRRLREIFREIEVTDSPEDAEGWDIVATARPEAADATYDELKTSAARLISRLKSR